MPRLKDYQKTKVYDWEVKLAGLETHLQAGLRLHKHPQMTLPQCRDMVSKISRHYGIRRPYLKPGIGMSRAVAEGCYVVQIPAKLRMNWVVCHEMSHVVLFTHINPMVQEGRRLAPTLSDHGSWFVGIYMHLLNYIVKVPISLLKCTADMDGVDYVDPDRCGRLALNARFREMRSEDA